MKYFHPFTPDQLKQCDKEALLHAPFPNPFFYEPDTLSLTAAQQLQSELTTTNEGKMYGVLVVEYEGQIGYLQAYSGQAEAYENDNFVPAVYDYLQPDGYFKTHEAEISALNRQITEIENAKSYLEAQNALNRIQYEAQEAIARKQDAMTVAKMMRDKRRKETFISENDKAEMVRESQFLKAELHRVKRYYAAQITAAESVCNDFKGQVNTLKRSRKQKSDHLQRWLFAQFIFRNGKNEERNLLDIFRDYYFTLHPTTAITQRFTPETLLPPSGTGECCEPKLLQYAYTHNMRPLSMAMFWWGASPRTEIRQHANFYPACNGKCKPLLTWMLKGLNVAPNPLEQQAAQSLEIVYEDNDLAVVNKPSGMLSVQGRSQRESVYSILKQRWENENEPFMVHRLDMATSGLMVVARNKETHQHLQAQFKAHTIVKRYTALLDVSILKANLPREGSIALPLTPDPLDRPRQKVDFQNGKQALTQYRIIGETILTDSKIKRAVKVELSPKTGRTHQLRVHCAHCEGLSTPIIGDTLYGTAADRLYLHAAHLAFTHPRSGERKCFDKEL